MKSFIVSPELPDPAPYAHAVRVDGILYTSAIAPLDRAGGLVAPGDILAQARHVYASLDSILRAAGAQWKDVVKVNNFVTPPGISRSELEGLREIMAGFLPPLQQAGTDICFDPVHDGQRIQVEIIAQTGVDKRILPGTGNGTAGTLWAQGVRAGRHVYLSARRAAPTGLRGLREETADVYGAFAELLEQAAVELADIVRVRQFVSDPGADFNHVREGRTAYVPQGAFTSTSVSCLPVHPLAPEFADWAIAVDLEASTGIKLSTNTSAMPIAPATAHAIAVGPLVHLQAEIATDRDDVLLYPGDIDAQARYVFQNMTKLLEAAGCDWSDVVTSRVFCRQAEHIEPTRRAERLWAGSAVYARSDAVCRFFDSEALVEVELTAARR